MTLIQLLRRQNRHSRWPSILLAGIVLVVSALLCAWPRAVDAMYTADLKQSVANVPGYQQAVQATISNVPPFGDTDQLMEETDDAGATAAALTGIREDLIAPLGNVLTEGRWLATGVESYVGPLPEGIRELILNYAADLRVLEHIELVDGELPGPAPENYGGAPIGILLSEGAAESAQWKVGEERVTSVLLPPLPGTDDPVGEQRVVLSGIYAAIDPEEDYWSIHNSFLSAAEDYNPDSGTAVNATAFISPDAFELVVYMVDGFRTSYWYPLNTGALDARTASQAEAQLREFLGTPQNVPAEGLFEPAVVFGSDTPDAINEATQRAASTNQILAMLASGPLGVCLATAALAVRLLTQRRRTTLALVSARGATERQVRGSLALDGLIIGVPAAALGALAAVILIPVPFTPSHLAWGVAAALVPAALMALQYRGSAEGREDLAPLEGNRWRIVAEAAVVVLAVVATTLLFQRGIAQGTLAYGEVDPLLSATPLLIALALCLLVLRLYPVPLQWFARVRRRGPGLIGFLGAARAVRSPGAGLVPVLALVVGLAVVLFSGVLLSTFREGVADAAQASVGADLRIQGSPFTPEQVEAAAALDGVRAVAPVTDLGSLRAETAGRQSITVNLLATDPAAMRGVQTDLAGALSPVLMTALEEPAADGTIPVVVSSALEVEEGAVLSISYRATRFKAEVVGIAEQQSVLTGASNWMLASQDAINTVKERTFEPSVLFADLDDGANLSAVMDAVGEVAGTPVLLQTPEQYVERTLDSPSGFGLQVGLWTVIAAMALLCSLTIVMTSVVNAPARNRLIALLRTLGFPPRRDDGLMLWETAPLAVAAVIAGTGLGLVLPVIILDSIDLSAFTGGGAEPGLALDPLLVAGLTAGFLAVVVGSLGAAVAAGRRQRLAAVLRMTDS